MKNIKRQQGVTAIGWLIILGLIAFFVTLALKLFPVYSENFNVKSSLKSMEKTQGLYKNSTAKIRSLLQRKLDINNVKSVTKKNVKINKRNGVVVINVNYSVKVPLVGALSLVADFYETAEAAN